MRTSTTIEEVDGRLEQEYEQRLLEALRDIRSQHEIDLHTVRSELEILYENKVSECFARRNPLSVSLSLSFSRELSVNKV